MGTLSERLRVHTTGTYDRETDRPDPVVRRRSRAFDRRRDGPDAPEKSRFARFESSRALLPTIRVEDRTVEGPTVGGQKVVGDRVVRVHGSA